MQELMRPIERGFIALILALAWLILVTGCAGTGRQAPVDDIAETPKIVFETLAHDFGTVKPGTSLTHSFLFKNKGSTELLIEKVKAG